MAYSLDMGPGDTESDGGQLTLDVQVVAGLSSLSDGDALRPRRRKRPTGRRWEEGTTETAAVMLQSPNLIGLLVVRHPCPAFVGTYPQGLFDLVVDLNRWVLRSVIYMALMTDLRPPLHLETGGAESDENGVDERHLGTRWGSGECALSSDRGQSPFSTRVSSVSSSTSRFWCFQQRSRSSVRRSFGRSFRFPRQRRRARGNSPPLG